MTLNEYEQTGFSGTLWAMHNGVEKFVASAYFPDHLFGLLPARPSNDSFTDESWAKVEWVRCEEVESTFYKECGTEPSVSASDMPVFPFTVLDMENPAVVNMDDSTMVVYAHHKESNLYALIEDIPDECETFNPIWVRGEKLGEFFRPKEHINPDQLCMFGFSE
ncbi:hypothetical protein OTK49_02585 [Vibrio coralliirubri]|uniref:hypothetical protein n=1 Tax=Vibrio coralliirubri TaxID=1516159 RepID=UPI002283C3F7|nr:hypothetical protein [Vibrio coralliirubri]MCY9861404.1 hypothetical protein [Vibrio coralliirubri]